MTRRVDYFVTFKGQEVVARCDIHPADSSVGIFGPFPETCQLIDPETGKDLETLGLAQPAEVEQFLNYDHPNGRALQEQIDAEYYGEYDYMEERIKVSKTPEVK